MWQKFKKWIIGFFLGGAVLAAGLTQIDQQKIIEAKNIKLANKQIALSFIDNNDNETVIVRTDKSHYSGGLRQATIYGSFVNTQDDELFKVQFPAKDVELKAFYYLATTTKKEYLPIYKHEYKKCDNTGMDCDIKIQIGTTTKIKQIDKWLPIKLLEAEKLLAIQKKPTIGSAKKQFSVFLQKNKPLYWKAIIGYPFRHRGEFFIEGFGANGGYFHLDPWYNSNWTYRQKITIDNTKIDSDLTNFPVYIDLSTLGDTFWNNTNCGDIRIASSSGDGELAREIVSCATSTETGQLWFRADSISSSVDTDFYIYFGNASASDYAVTDTYGRNNVWSDYNAVWHQEETSGTTATDSAGNYDGTYTGDIPDTARGGKIGNGQDYDGSGDYISTSDYADFSNGDFSFSAWVYTDVGGDKPIISRWGGGGSNCWDLRAGWGGGNPTNAWTFMWTTTGNNEAARYGDTYDTGAWRYITVVKRSGNLYIGENGVETNTGAFSDTIYNDATVPVNVGKFPGYAIYFDGIIDEARIIVGTGVSAAWMGAEYDNQNSPSTFYATSTPETQEGGGSIPQTLHTNTIIF